MRAIIVVPALLLALAAGTGCASYANLGTEDGWKVYGGARLDATLISEGFAPTKEVTQKNVERPVLVMEGCSGLVDLPFSAIVDTVLLPVTVPIAIARMAENSAADAPPAKKEQRRAE
jgi:uncharacterized protein YceK